MLYKIIIALNMIYIAHGYLGVNFQHRGRLEYVASFHQIAVEVKLKPIIVELDVVKQSTIKIRDRIITSGSKNDSRYADYIIEQVDNLKRRTIDLEMTEGILQLPTIGNENKYPEDFVKSLKKRRGLIDGIGKAASYLFGIATEEEISEANTKIGKIQTSTNEVITEVNKQVTVLHELSEEVSNIRTIVDQVREAVGMAYAAKTRYELMEHILWLQSMVNRLNNNLNTIDIGLQKMKKGKVAPEIISSNSIAKVLNNLSRKRHELLFNKENRVPAYMDLSIVVPVPAGEDRAIRFMILIPIKDLSFTFHLFEIITIPIWNSTMNLGIKYDLESNYLAVSQDLTAFSPMKTIDECQNNGEVYLCPAGQPIFLRENKRCEILLYTQGDTLNKECPRTVYTDETPKFTRVKEGYMYSVPKPLEVTIQCATTPPTVKTYKISGMGILRLNPGCHAIGEGILLVSPDGIRTQGDTWIVEPVNVFNGSLLFDDEAKILAENNLLIRDHLLNETDGTAKLPRLLGGLNRLNNVKFNQDLMSKDPVSRAIIFCILMMILLCGVCVFLKRCNVVQTITKWRGRKQSHDVEQPQELTEMISPGTSEVRSSRFS